MNTLAYGTSVEWLIKNKAWWARTNKQFRIYGKCISFVHNCPVKFK